MRNRAFLLLLCAALVFWLPAKADADRVPEYPVVVVDSIFFTAEEPCQSTVKGGSVSFLLRYAPGYGFSSCSADNYTAEQTEDGTLLTVREVDRAQRVHVSSVRLAAEDEEPWLSVIAYEANGGQWAQPDEKGGSRHTVTTALSYHIRPNTDTGTTLSRRGYTLLGWNTAPDGSGTHIGLGSRTDADTALLWAEWLPWMDAAEFTFRRNGSTIVLTGYKGQGNLDTLVIPAAIDSLPVAGIAGSFTTNIPCGTLRARRLVLPDTLQFIENNAFQPGILRSCSSMTA